LAELLSRWPGDSDLLVREHGQHKDAACVTGPVSLPRTHWSLIAVVAILAVALLALGGCS